MTGKRKIVIWAFGIATLGGVLAASARCHSQGTADNDKGRCP